LLTNANIRARIVQIERDAALSSLSTALASKLRAGI
jgi:hypothetical protein